MVPKAYLYASPPRTNSSVESEKSTTAASGPTVKRDGGETAEGAPNARSAKPVMISTAPASTPSKPVVIPTRSQGTRISAREDRRKSQLVRKEDIKSHDPRLIPSSVAAVLAITSIPPSRIRSKRKGVYTGLVSDANVEVLEGFDPHDIPRSVSSSSLHSWDVLHSPPTELDEDHHSLSSDTTLAAGSSLRSMSNESIPSLGTEFDSSASLRSPITPGKLPSKRGRRPKTSSSWQAKDCGFDHPLSPSRQELKMDRQPQPQDAAMLSPDIRKPVLISRSSFKSNLTASLQLLRSAAKSLSNFTAPVVQRDEFLARSLLLASPQFTDERRPRLSEADPDPALRRYLNPTTLSPSELHVYHNHERGHVQRNNCTISIQLQAYQRSTSSSKKATSPPVFIASTDLPPLTESSTEVYLSTRQREPRENSDFLRVIVMEMNMRRAGKLKDADLGRARIWLPARQVVKQEIVEVMSVPRRWSGIMT